MLPMRLTTNLSYRLLLLFCSVYRTADMQTAQINFLQLFFKLDTSLLECLNNNTASILQDVISKLHSPLSGRTSLKICQLLFTSMRSLRLIKMESRAVAAAILRVTSFACMFVSTSETEQLRAASQLLDEKVCSGQIAHALQFLSPGASYLPGFEFFDVMVESPCDLLDSGQV